MQCITDCESLGCCTDEGNLYGALLSQKYALFVPLLCRLCKCISRFLSVCLSACVSGRISPFFKYISRSICPSMCVHRSIASLYSLSRSFRVWCLFTLHWSLRNRDIKKVQQILLNDFIITHIYRENYEIGLF